jgi:hypothetical protein
VSGARSRTWQTQIVEGQHHDVDQAVTAEFLGAFVAT